MELLLYFQGVGAREVRISTGYGTEKKKFWEMILQKKIIDSTIIPKVKNKTKVHFKDFGNGSLKNCIVSFELPENRF